jgi:Ca2+-binding RTX toxin-like protein
MPTPIRIGQEQALSSDQGITNGSFNAITPLANGSFVTAVSFKSGVQIFIHNADGSLKSQSFLNAPEGNATFTTLSDGGFVVSWHEEVPDSTSPNKWNAYIQASIYNADGTVRRSPFRVNEIETKTDYNGSITALANGGFAVTYTNRSVEGDRDDDNDGVIDRDLGVLVKTFDANGNALANGVRVNNSDGSRDQEDPSVAGLTGGGLVVVYSDDAGHPNGPDVKATIRGKVIVNGTHSTEFVVPQTGAGYQYDPQVAALADGRFVVTWTYQNYARPQDGDDVSVYARIYNANGTAATDSFRVNTTTYWDQHQSSVTALRNGGFAVAFTSADSDRTDDYGEIRVQLFTASGQKDGAEFLVNTTVRGSQTEPVIKELADGRVVVGWTDEPIRDGAVNARFQILDVGYTVTLPDPSSNQPSAGNDVLTGTGAANTINGLAGNDEISGLGGNDRLYGGAGNDHLIGGSGNDKLYGDTGIDRLIGGTGQDTLYGQSGGDRFVFDDRDTSASKTKADYLADFSGRGGDKIDLKLIDANTKKGGDQNFSFIGTKAFSKAGEARYEKVKGYTYVYLNTDSDKSAEAVLKLKGVMTLQKSWFLL